MTLSSGTHLGPYEILSALGAGGMGEVYRAKDTRLDREVAIKVLPDLFARDKERVARFQREAKVLASLNHPNIAAIHGLEESEGKRFLVMELAEGDTLAGRLKAGPMPVEEALHVGKQIAEALEAAHERGVIHRDLKPANVKVTPDGKVKVLDFGLAKAFAADDRSQTEIAQSPTITADYTRPGVVLGTAAYMSPEQARGKPLDKRTDIWSFGCVLYECFAGRRPFDGETTTDLIAKILERDPDFDTLPDNIPLTIRSLLRRCLEKDRKRRLRDIGDARIELDEALSAPASAWTITAGTLAPRAGSRRVMPWVLGGLTALASGVAVWHLKPSPLPTPGPVTRSALLLSASATLASPTGHPSIALSPDGTRLVYVARRGSSTQLYLRPMDQLNAKPIPGTEGASMPFFSPDGQWVGFFAAGKLKKVSLMGGVALSLCDAPRNRGASWGPDDTIRFTPVYTSGLWSISAAGGTPQVVTTPDSTKGELSHRWPEVLPGGKAVLFTVETAGSFDNASIAVLSLQSGEQRCLVEGGSNPHYASSGHLVFARAGVVLAAPFDLGRLEMTGAPVAMLEGVMENPGTGAAQFSISGVGSLVYVPGGAVAEGALVWVDRQGTTEPLGANRRAFADPRLSPDGQRVAVTVNRRDIWVCEVARGTLTKFTFDPGVDESPVWTPDGNRVTFSSSRTGAFNLFWKLADGTDPSELLLTSEYDRSPTSWSPDGKMLAFEEQHPTTGFDIWLLPMEAGRLPTAAGKPQPFLRTEFDERVAVFSPDGRWLAYSSNESGRYEVYVQPYPGPGRKWLISTGGGYQPVWTPNREDLELFYHNGNKMMVVAIQTEPTFSPGAPKPLFEFEEASVFPRFDISPDGQHFVMIQKGEQSAAPAQLRVVLNWFEELKRLVPMGTEQ